jgi:hypothetical protein
VKMPVVVGWITLAAGAALLAAPGRTAAALGLEGQDTALRLLGAADLALVPGLLADRPRWMIARAGLNLAQAAYLLGVAPQSSQPDRVKAGAAALLGLTVVDGATGLRG